MKKTEPYYYTTKNFLHTYHGGGYSPEQLKSYHRGTIKTFTRASMKRLCIKLDSIIGFNPEWKLTITYFELPDWNMVRNTINKFTTRLSISRYSKFKPIWIWKKNIINSNLTLIIITNIRPFFSPKTFRQAAEYYWNSYSPITIKQIKLEKIKTSNDVILDFCFNNTIDTVYPFGKWWGIINQNSYKKEPICKNQCSLFEIEIIELQNKDKFIKTAEFKKNLYKK